MEMMIDNKGRHVPIQHVKPEHKLEDELVLKAIARAQELSESLRVFREATFSDLRGFLDLLAQEYQVRRGGQKGNVTLTSFDGTKKVTIAVAEFLSFGPELHAAKALIDECLVDWSEGAGTELQTIVTDAFRVNKEGKLDVDAILGLRRHAFADPRWSRAMEAISAAIRVSSSKEYVRFHVRSAPDQAWKQIPLDIAGL